MVELLPIKYNLTVFFLLVGFNLEGKEEMGKSAACDPNCISFFSFIDSQKCTD